jgi:transposase InsO family protein
VALLLLLLLEVLQLRLQQRGGVLLRLHAALPRGGLLPQLLQQRGLVLLLACSAARMRRRVLQRRHQALQLLQALQQGLLALATPAAACRLIDACWDITRDWTRAGADAVLRCCCWQCGGWRAGPSRLLLLLLLLLLLAVC